MWGWVCFLVLLIWVCMVCLRDYSKKSKEYHEFRDNIYESQVTIEEKWNVFEVKTQSGDVYVFSEDRYEYEMDSDKEYIELSKNKSLYKNTFETVEEKCFGKGLVRFNDYILPCRMEIGSQSGRPIKIYYRDTYPSGEKMAVMNILNKEEKKFGCHYGWSSKEYLKVKIDYDYNIID